MALPVSEAKATMGDVSSDSVTMTLVDPFDQRNGRITAYSVIITTDKTDTDINNGLRNKWRDRKTGMAGTFVDNKIFNKYLANVSD